MAIRITAGGARLEIRHTDRRSTARCKSTCGRVRFFYPELTPAPVTDAEAWAERHAKECTALPVRRLDK